MMYAARQRVHVRLVHEPKDKDGVSRWYWESRATAVPGWEAVTCW